MFDTQTQRICRSQKSIPSIIKWTGGKRSQAYAISNLAPSFNRYIEPFLGGGAMMFLGGHPGAIGNDIYLPLIELWKQIRDNPDQLLEDYTAEWKRLSEELDAINSERLTRGSGLPKTFYNARDRFNKKPNATDLNFLMRTCVNGIIRFNDKGAFNNSFHLSRRGMKPHNFSIALQQWKSILQDVELTCQDYREVLERAKKGDFVYLDPPYAATKQRYASALSPESLFEQLDILNRRGVSWALSYDGYRGTENLVYDIPKDLFKTHHLLQSGNSAVKKVLSKSSELVRESLYLNY